MEGCFPQAVLLARSLVSLDAIGGYCSRPTCTVALRQDAGPTAYYHIPTREAK